MLEIKTLLTYRIFNLALIFLLVFSSNDLYSQESKGANPSDVTSSEYQSIIDNLDYSKTTNRLSLKKRGKKEIEPTKEKKKKRNRRSSGLSFQTSGIFNILAYIGIGVLALVILYIIFSGITSDKKIKGDTPIIVDEIEHIDDVETKSALQIALENGNYRLAVRLQFIASLQMLNTGALILWQKEKTNRDYLRELSGNKLFGPFGKIAHIYEYVWYGNHEVDHDSYFAISPSFDQFNQVFHEE